jgi:2-polyprenyl-6-methoxyphenol hydroxylase-like FAD-dependent oxidoreductase
VGFGPTGATLANLLGREAVRTLVVERAPEIYTLPRAVHFDHEVMRIFQSVGLADRILPHTGPVGGYEFRNGDGEMLMCFELRDTITSQGWRPDYMFHQPSLERVLREGAEERDAVEVRLGQELVKLEEDRGGVTLMVRDAADAIERRVRTQYVVGCDGASSPTRQLAGLETQDLQFDEPWLVVDATVERPVEELDFPRVPLQHCDPRRPTTVIPVVGPYVRWEFMLLPGEGLEMQEPGRVRELVAEWVDPDEVEVIRSAVYRFHAVVGVQWRTRRVFVAGDAAHQMPPFLGQGMCAGIRDADNLAWKLRLVLEGRAGDALLDTYQAERAPPVRTVIDTAVERRCRVSRTGCSSPSRDTPSQASSGSRRASAPADARVCWTISWGPASRSSGTAARRRLPTTPARCWSAWACSRWRSVVQSPTRARPSWRWMTWTGPTPAGSSATMPPRSSSAPTTRSLVRRPARPPRTHSSWHSPRRSVSSTPRSPRRSSQEDLFSWAARLPGGRDLRRAGWQRGPQNLRPAPVCARRAGLTRPLASSRFP